MGREVKDIIIHVEILMYHWSDPVYNEGIREPDERVCSQRRCLYRLLCSSVDDSEGDDLMDEIEQPLPLLVAAHEYIAGRDTLCWTPCR